MFSIGGIASGLDTTSIIQQLMQIERQPVVRYQQRQAELRAVDDAWGKVVSKLSSLRTAVDDVRHAADWRGFSAATSSNEAAVTAKVTGAIEPASTSFTVSKLAKAHQIALSGQYASAGTALEAGTFEIRDAAGGLVESFTTDGTQSLADLAKAINDASVGVKAQTIKTSDSGYQLVLDATFTGDESQFQVSTSIASLGTATATQTGSDAELQFGGVTVTRSKNTVTDLIDGVTLELRATTTDPVTITTSRDTDKAVAAVKALVDAANGVLKELGTQTRYDAEKKKAGALQGESLARQLAVGLRDALSGAVSGGTITHASQVGLSLERDGTVKFDQSKLEAALANDVSAVGKFFGESVSGVAGVELVSTTSKTVPGDYAVQIDTAPTIAMVTGASYTPPSGSPKTFTITAGGTPVSVTIEDGATVSSAATAIRAALARAGVSDLDVSDDGSVLTLAATSPGDSSFSISGWDVDGVNDGLDGTYQGQDIVGSFAAATTTDASGETLRAIGGDVGGLTVRYTGSDPVSGTLTLNAGLGGVIDSFLSRAEGAEGSVQRARDAISGRISRFDDQIEAFEVRLDLRETALRRQFTALETAMGTLTSQGNWLAGQIAGLSGGQG